MKVGIWNIDCPENRSKRFKEISEFINVQNCDLLIITEANAALFDQYPHSMYSRESPFKNNSRDYSRPNKYHQVGIVSKEVKVTKQLSREPINSVIGELEINKTKLKVLGSVFTIKDQWAKWSHLKYTERANQQFEEIKKLAHHDFICAGDFNFRWNSKTRKNSYVKLKELKNELGFCWPTEKETRTVQQIIHSRGIETQYELIPVGKLSDHPFIKCSIKLKWATFE